MSWNLVRIYFGWRGIFELRHRVYIDNASGGIGELLAVDRGVNFIALILCFPPLPMIRIEHMLAHINYRLEAPTYDNNRTVRSLFNDLQLEMWADHDAGEGWGLIIDLARERDMQCESKLV